jgi:hypothetical protein
MTKEALRKYYREYYQNNKKRCQEYYEKNAERILKKRHEDYMNNKELYQNRFKEYYEKHRSEIIEKTHEYRKKSYRMV